MQARHRATPPGPPPVIIPERAVTGILASDWSEHWRQHTMSISRQPIRGRADSTRQKHPSVLFQSWSTPHKENTCQQCKYFAGLETGKYYHWIFCIIVVNKYYYTRCCHFHLILIIIRRAFMYYVSRFRGEGLK